eukprot:scpid54071/ scgid34871/ 
MGNLGSRSSGGDVTASARREETGRWLCVDIDSAPSRSGTSTSSRRMNGSSCRGTGPRKLEYDPSQSRAVLCAVNKFQTEAFVDSEISVPVGRQYSDAQRFSLCLQGGEESRGGLNSQDIAVLDDDADGPLGYTPTKENITDLLKEQARGVGKDGMLLFYFSGHARRTKEGKVFLLPTDYDGIIAHGIRSEDISSALSASTARHVVLVFDCCESDGLAHELIDFDSANSIQCGSAVYAVVTCSGRETALFHHQIGGGVFSYFLIDHMNRTWQDDATRLDLVQSVQFCQPLYNALSWLAEYAHTSADSQSLAATSGPQLVTSGMEMHTLYLHDDSPDGSKGQTPPPLMFTLLSHHYARTDSAQPDQMVLHPPTQLRKWLRDVVGTCLAQLECNGFVSSSRHPTLFNALVAMVSSSAAEIVIAHAKEKCMDPNLFIHCILPVIDTFYILKDRLVDEWTLEHVVLSLRYYMATIKEYREPQVKVEEMGALTELMLRLQLTDTIDGKVRQEKRLSPQDVFDQLPNCALARFPS